MPRLARLLVAASVLALLGTDAGGAQALDCSGYDSQVWAQTVFESDPARYSTLDLDGNGLACEELPPGAAPALWTNEIPAGAVPVTLASVTDGDTIRVFLNGVNEPVRLILIDTPETNDPNNPRECFGSEATAYLTWLLSLGGTLYLESDVTDRDRFDRLLRYAWLDFGGGEVYLVNEAMARSGYASQSTYPPDVKYESQIREAAAFAREHGYGLWSACETDAGGDTNALDAFVGYSTQYDAATGEMVLYDESGREVQRWPAYGSPGATLSTASPGTTMIGPDGRARAPTTPPRDPLAEIATAEEARQSVAAPSSQECDAAYPDVCIPPVWLSGDLECDAITARRFRVVPPDPHFFDGDFDGIGCEWG